MKFIQIINLPLVPNLYSVKWGKTEIFKIGFNVKFCSYIEPGLINGCFPTKDIQTHPLPLSEMANLT